MAKRRKSTKDAKVGQTSKGRKSIRDARAEQEVKKHKSRWLKRTLFLLLELVILFGLLSIGYMLHQYGEIRTDFFDKDNIVVNEGVKQEGYRTVVLFGADSREGELGAGSHADTMMIASIDNETKEVKIVSVYRDTPMKQKDGEILKANSAYFLGGPQEAINMLNRNLDLDIREYVTVDFKILADVIDLLGGIEVEVTAAEAQEINKYIYETAAVAEKGANPVSGGLQTLDGVQAVTYARIRKNVGGDYARTERQRLVVSKIVEKVKKTNLSTISDIINSAFSSVSTNIELSEILELTADIMKYEISETSGYPFEKEDGSIEGVGSVVLPVGMIENVERLHTFLYPKAGYKVSDTVKDIELDVEFLISQTTEETEETEETKETEETEETEEASQAEPEE